MNRAQSRWETHNQIDYNLKEAIPIRKRSFPGADIESDHDLVMMAF